MIGKKITNLNIDFEESIISPAELKKQYPPNERAVRTVLHGQTTIKNILAHKDHRLFMVVGPCSIHDVAAAQEYARRLKGLAEEVKDTLFLVMRVYFEKPRTRDGWQGLINDPHLDKSGRMQDGIPLARELLLDITGLGLPAAGEALDVISPQYLQDLFSWTAIGARTAESQTHRRMASGMSTAVGFKNGTNGNISVAINAMHTAANPASFLSIGPSGQVVVVHTRGNLNTHIVLRGGGNRENYDASGILTCEKLLSEACLPENIMVDCSHANSQSDPARQPLVLQNVTNQIIAGNKSIIGLMMESNLEWGKQEIPQDLSRLRYGVSITDACIDWKTTEKVLLETHQRLQNILAERVGRHNDQLAGFAQQADEIQTESLKH